MVLPPSLLNYAENIWLRFPEAFFALGLPQLEDVFEINEGSWCYRVVDTSAEKVVEIVLPRRKTHSGSVEHGLGAYFEAERENRSLMPFSQQVSSRLEAVLSGTGKSSALGSDVAGHVRKLGLHAGNLRKSIQDCVSREIRAQLSEVHPENTRGSPGRDDPLPATQGRLAQRGADSCTGQVKPSRTKLSAAQSAESPRGEDESPGISPTGSCVSWTSSLAMRRGVDIGHIDLKPISDRRKMMAGGSGAVKRAPQLDRAYSPSLLSEGGGFSRQYSMTSNCTVQFDDSISQHGNQVDQVSSPGALMQRLAQRREHNPF